MTVAGIDCDMFSMPSARAAATSSTKALRVYISSILNTAGWPNEFPFAKIKQNPSRHIWMLFLHTMF